PAPPQGYARRPGTPKSPAGDRGHAIPETDQVRANSPDPGSCRGPLPLPFQQLNILLMLEQDFPVGQFRQPGALFERLEVNAPMVQDTDPVDQLAGGGRLAKPSDLPKLVQAVDRSLHELRRDVQSLRVDPDDRQQALAGWELDEMKETAAQEGVGQLLLIVAG